MDKPKFVQQPPVPGGSTYKPPAVPHTIELDTIYLHPNPNADGYEDNWVCEHIDMQTGKHDGDTWFCEACAKLYEGGALIVKVSADKDKPSHFLPVTKKCDECDNVGPCNPFNGLCVACEERWEKAEQDLQDNRSRTGK